MEQAILESTKYGAPAIAIGALVIILYIVREFLKRMDTMDLRHQEAFNKVSDSMTYAATTINQALNKNTKVTDETYQFLRNLNGKLIGIVKETVRNHKE